MKKLNKLKKFNLGKNYWKLLNINLKMSQVSFIFVFAG